ncbi:hypothetical protein [Mesorhizobium sp. J428]|uniref:hypothetical protein n=1 Tax=Mesorhizobium sp. J428 TaxID=2898440 RepID=UPI002150D7BD|nr:hypothetical protein [Mesorhizobium sp. J428]MCR5858255.1 hypothetical protein [Mesorhizobium sp. J428]
MSIAETPDLQHILSMRTLAALAFLLGATTVPAAAFSDVEMVPAYVNECPALALNAKRYEEVLTATLAANSNGIKGADEARSRILPGVYIEPGQRAAFCREYCRTTDPKVAR